MISEREIEAVYPLSPLQQGMLFDVLFKPESGVYVEQFCYLLRGALDIASFEKAWNDVTQRHSALRTAFVWKQTAKMLQTVFRDVTQSLTLLDWRDADPEQHRARLRELLADDRQRGFDLGAAPLMRLTLARLSEREWYFVWSHHHLVMDGWSAALLLHEVAACYSARRRGERAILPPVRPYRDHIEWLQQQDVEVARRFWREYLSGYTAPTPLPLDRTGDPGSSERLERTISLSDSTTAALERMAHERRLTLGTIVQVAWALLLSGCSGDSRVVFGCAVSGRTAALPGIE